MFTLSLHETRQQELSTHNAEKFHSKNSHTYPSVKKPKTEQPLAKVVKKRNIKKQMECYPYALLKSATSLELHLGLTKNLFTVKVNF